MDDIASLEEQISLAKSEGAIIYQPWNEDLVKFLGCSVLLFALAISLIGATLLWKKNADGVQMLKFFGTVTIVSLTAFLLIIGYDNDQLTPTIGLFGAIVGYLLGRESQPA